MADITAAMIGQLRQETGAPMMKCKTALTEAGGDMEEARTLLRKMGAAAAEKAAGKQASEGVVEASVFQSGSVGVILELNCQTDFVARNEDFRVLANEIARQIATAETADTYPTVEALLAAQSTTAGAEGKTVAELLNENIARMGEKIAVARFTRFDAAPEKGAVGAYLHNTDFKTGVLVEVAADGDVKSMDTLAALAREVSLHVAAANPEFVSRDEVPADIIAREREIAQAKADADPSFAKKPEAAKTAMLDGQVRKYLEQFVLLEQSFVRDPSGKQKVSHLVETATKEAGAPVKIVRFARYKVGQTAEVTQEDV